MTQMNRGESAPPYPLEAELAKFIYKEARLLDEKRFDEWYELFTEDAHYWVPLVPGQTDPAHP